jgi:hypothetical protein
MQCKQLLPWLACTAALICGQHDCPLNQLPPYRRLHPCLTCAMAPAECFCCCGRPSAIKPLHCFERSYPIALSDPTPNPSAAHLRGCQLVHKCIAAVLVPVALEDAVGCLQHSVDNCQVPVGSCRKRQHTAAHTAFETTAAGTSPCLQCMFANCSDGYTIAAMCRV